MHLPTRSFLSHFKNVIETRTGWKAICPCHDDHKQSCNVKEGVKGVLSSCMVCQATHQMICAAVGVPIFDTFWDAEEKRRELQVAEVSKPNGSHRKRGEVVARHVYEDAEGKPWQRVVREHTPDPESPKGYEKECWAQHWKGGRWENGLGGLPRLLYRLPQIKAAPSALVYWVEGENKVEALESVGLLATTSIGGVGQVGQLADVSALSGREVWILPDDDPKGREYAETVRRALQAVTDRCYILPELPGLRDTIPEKGDVADWLRAGHTAAELVSLTDRPVVSVTSQPLPVAIATFKKWLYLEDEGHIKVALGAYAANRMNGPPVWLMLVGGPSSGKTEAIASMARLPYLHSESSLSGEAALLSGTANKEKSTQASGGILHRMGKFGVLVLKDFTSILSMRSDNRAPLLAALREVYDGSWNRSVGVDGGRTLSWSGKIGMIACCTPIIDSHHAVIGAMGERFVFYRLPVVDADQQARASLGLFGMEAAMRGEFAKAVSALFAGINMDADPPPLTSTERDRLIDMATLAVKCRSAVERDGRTREILLIPDAEAPSRLAGVLLGLLNGMSAVGVEREEAWKLLAKVATDSMPALRWKAFIHAANTLPEYAIKTTEFAIALDHPTVTVRRALEELNAHGLLSRKRDGFADNAPSLWALTPWARDRYNRLSYLFDHEPRHEEGSVSEMSEYTEEEEDSYEWQ